MDNPNETPPTDRRWRWRSTVLHAAWWVLMVGAVVGTATAAIAHADARVYWLFIVMMIGAAVCGGVDRALAVRYPRRYGGEDPSDRDASTPVVGRSPYEVDDRSPVNGRTRTEAITYHDHRAGPADAVDEDAPRPITRAPWTKEQVDAINRFQERDGVERYVCRLHLARDVVLIAATDHMFCPRMGCGHRQDWVYDATLEEVEEP